MELLMAARIQRYKWWLVGLVFLGLLAMILSRWRSGKEHSQDEVILQAALRYNLHPALIKAVVSLSRWVPLRCT